MKTFEKYCLAKFLVSITISLPMVSYAQASSDHSTVILYGVVDLGISSVHVSQDATSKNPALNTNHIQMDSGVQSGSRWGLKGFDKISEDLAVRFVLESGINAQTGRAGQGGRAFGRQSTLGLSSKLYGETDWGRQINAASRYFGSIDPFELSFGQANMGTSFGQANTLRYDNMVMLQSIDYSGFQGLIGYSFNVGQSALYADGPNVTIQPTTENFGTLNNARAFTAGIRYMADKLIMVASFDAAFGSSQVRSLSDNSVNIDNPNAPVPKMWALGAKYDLGFMNVSAAVGQGFNGAFSGQGSGNGLNDTGLATFTGGAGILFQSGYDHQSFMLGGMVPISGDSNLMFSWQMMQPRGQLSQNAGYASQSILGAAYTYNLSKHTNLYVWGSVANNFQMISTAKTQTIGAGIRHLF
jgi:predicted porin